MTRIGRSDLDILPLALGGNVFGYTADRDASFEILDAFTAGGGDFVDTAEGYSSWVPGNDGFDSERIIGEWIAARRPEGFLVATKTGGHRSFRDLRPERVRAAADASLARLHVDAIDLYWLHYDDPEVPLEVQVETFAGLVAAGKVRWLGLSNYAPERLAAWIAEAERQGAPLPVAFQPHYNLVHRNEVEERVIPIAAEHGISLLPYYGLAAGFLTGKYRSTEPPADASPRAAGAATYATPQGLAIVDELERIGAAHGASIAATALAWLRVQPMVAAPIASASRVDQVPDLLASATLELTADELAALDRISDWSPAA